MIRLLFFTLWVSICNSKQSYRYIISIQLSSQ